jgi:acyl carrier protein
MKDDASLPTTRPEKYPWMIHSEVNAISSTRSRADLEGAVACITGPPCVNCMMQMWQAGIRKVKYIDGYGWSKDEQERAIREEFIRQSGMELIPMKPDLTWLADLVLGMPELKEYLLKAILADKELNKAICAEWFNGEVGEMVRQDAYAMPRKDEVVVFNPISRAICERPHVAESKRVVLSPIGADKVEKSVREFQSYEEIVEAVRECVANEAIVSVTDVAANDTLDSLHLDSLDTVTLSMELEDLFDCVITETESAKWVTVKDIIDTVMSRKRSGSPPIDSVPAR